MTTKRNEKNEKKNATDVADYLVERLAAGDLPAARAADVRRRLELDPAGTERLNGLALSNRRILEDHPPPMVAHEVRRRSLMAQDHAPTSRIVHGSRRWGIAIGAPGALLAALALALWLRPTAQGPRGGAATDQADTAAGDSDRGKGLRPSLRIYRKSSGTIERLKDGASTRAGDQLQVAYVAAGHKYGVVLSVDGAGQVTYHLPAAAGTAVRLRVDGEIALPEAYELDAAPGFERFLLVVGDKPFDATALTALVRGEGRPPAGTVATSFTVRKE